MTRSPYQYYLPPICFYKTVRGKQNCHLKKHQSLHELIETELLVLGKSHVLKKFELIVRLQFGNTEILPTECKGDSWKSLCVKFDETLNMERQINNVKRKCSRTMMNLRTIGRYLDEGIKLM